MAWSVPETWLAAVEVAAAAHGVAEDAIRAQSRGRGYKPPPAVARARQCALYLTVLVSDCGYAELARHVGFHRDTVHSHCMEMQAHADVDRVELASERLEALVRQRLAAGMRSAAARLRARLEQMEADAAFAEASIVASSDSVPTFNRQVGGSVENILSLPARRRA